MVLVSGVQLSLRIAFSGLIHRTDGKEVGLADFAMNTKFRTFSRAHGGNDFARDERFFVVFKACGAGGMITAAITLYLPFHALRHTLSWPLAMFQRKVRQRTLHDAARAHVIRRVRGMG